MRADGLGDTAFSSSGAEMLVPTRYLYYFEAFFFRSLPTSAVLLFLFSFLFVFDSARSKKDPVFQKDRVFPIRKLVKAALMYLFVIWLFLSIPEKTKDRYLVNFMPGIAVLLAYSLYKILTLLKKIPSLQLSQDPVFPIRLDQFFLTLFICFYVIIFYSYYPVYSAYYNPLLGGAKGRETFGLQVKNRGEYYAQAAFFINDHLETNDAAENPGDYNVVIADAIRRPCFASYFYGKTFADSKMMPDGYFAHYVVSPKEMRYMVPGTCDLVTALGPRIPGRYNWLEVYYCGKTVDNSYKFSDQEL